MNDRCKQLGGYLAQTDDREEHDFLEFFSKYVRGSGPYFIGLNDVEREGFFRTYNDNKPAVYHKFRWFQPDSWWNEDCVTMGLNGLNDLRCGKRGKYICEVPNV
ncbi:collectin-11 [Plakobranchus ocellatus]|uniref:Collectin-11 n=1 Tax=Plakobranchus ocellatus TaxID=259542 RepID=A0AAV4BVL0_9GAST|nr:collectin-11 [Plakobranchus ocellatus]